MYRFSRSKMDIRYSIVNKKQSKVAMHSCIDFVMCLRPFKNRLHQNVDTAVTAEAPSVIANLAQRGRLDKCGSCCIKPMANRVRFFG